MTPQLVLPLATLVHVKQGWQQVTDGQWLLGNTHTLYMVNLVENLTQ